MCGGHVRRIKSFCLFNLIRRFHKPQKLNVSITLLHNCTIFLCSLRSTFPAVFGGVNLIQRNIIELDYLLLLALLKEYIYKSIYH